MPTGTEQEPAPPRRHADQEALEEIRQLFARYRRLARHGMVTERDEPSEAAAPGGKRAGTAGLPTDAGRAAPG